MVKDFPSFASFMGLCGFVGVSLSRVAGVSLPNDWYLTIWITIAIGAIFAFGHSVGKGDWK